MNKFKVGDKVKCKQCAYPQFNGVKEIAYIDDEETYARLEGGTMLYIEPELELVEEKVEYKFGEKYFVADCKEGFETRNSKFLIGYMPDKEYPFICVSGDSEDDYRRGCDKFSVIRWKYVKPIPKKTIQNLMKI